MQGLFKVLNSEKRIKILEFLLDKDDYVCVCEMDEVINRDRSVAYRHFKKLESAGILETRKNGKRIKAKVKNPEKIKKLFKISKKVVNNDN